MSVVGVRDALPDSYEHHLGRLLDCLLSMAPDDVVILLRVGRKQLRCAEVRPSSFEQTPSLFGLLRPQGVPGPPEEPSRQASRERRTAVPPAKNAV
jgi:hypothetical protein